MRLDRKITIASIKLLLLAWLAFGFQAVEARTGNKSSNLAVIKGSVQDESGNPIVGAIVSILNPKNSKLLKQIRTASDGSFVTKLLPGVYKIIAFAEGFNSQSVEAKVSKSAELVYGFRLERVGSGKTIIERKPDKSSQKYVIRAATLTRSIYQNVEGEEIKEKIQEKLEDLEEVSDQGSYTVIEYFNLGGSKSFQIARIQPLNETTKLVFVGQDRDILRHLQATLNHRIGENHQIQVSSSLAKFQKTINNDSQVNRLSLQFFDEWQVSPNLILVLGADYSDFADVSRSLTPRLGLQYDINSTTKLRSSFSAINEAENQLKTSEDVNSLLRETMTVPVALLDGDKLALKKSNRFETALERKLDEKSEAEIAFLLDFTTGEALDKNFQNRLFSQRGRGFRISYSRRFNDMFSASAGYAFGKVFSERPNQSSERFYQTFIGQLKAQLKNGTTLRAVLRLSPKAKLLAVDPFQGKFTIYDPSLNVLITQPLPNLGLPIRAEAIIDVRNLLDQQQNNNQETIMTAFHGRSFRGGILVKF